MGSAWFRAVVRVWGARGEGFGLSWGRFWALVGRALETVSSSRGEGLGPRALVERVSGSVSSFQYCHDSSSAILSQIRQADLLQWLLNHSVMDTSQQGYFLLVGNDFECFRMFFNSKHWLLWQSLKG